MFLENKQVEAEIVGFFASAKYKEKKINQIVSLDKSQS